MIHRELLSTLCCPETGQSLEPATAQELEGLNRKIAQGLIKKRNGNALHVPLENLLIRADRKVAYPLSGGIPVMLLEESLEWGGEEKNKWGEF